MYWVILLVIGLALSAGVAADWVIDYQWWKELGQEPTWWGLLLYGSLPVMAAGLAAAIVLWVALARGLKYGGTGLGQLPAPARWMSAGTLVLGYLLAAATVDSWTVMRWIGGRPTVGASGSWREPVFGNPLEFYLFSLPFFKVIFAYLLGLAVLTGLIFWISTRFGHIRSQLSGSGPIAMNISDLQLDLGLESGFLRAVAAIILLGIAVRTFLNRYTMLGAEHGFLVGIDYVDEHIRLPMVYLMTAACLAGAVLVILGRWRWLLLLPIAGLLQGVVPAAISALYVRPNEISLERPYIERHIQATRMAYGLSQRSKEEDHAMRADTAVDVQRHRLLLENVRLWDWRAFHDTLMQIQTLRPYYAFSDSDVDRYRIDGQLRQILVSPRELDIRQLPDAQRRWINPHFVYTHGYGLVMADAGKITPDGLPFLFVQDAPPQVKTASLKLTRPEIYYGERTHEPVFVSSGQQEFSYPSGNDSVFSRYQGTGGFPVDSWAMRLAAAIRGGDANILLTNLVTPGTRMMIRRDIRNRLHVLAGFVTWDPDPYIVVTSDGRSVWVVDGYTTSNDHPYSQRSELGGRRINYVRNSVKAAVDAYHGSVRMYIVDSADPVLNAYARLFPKLFEPASAIPAELREHFRYPEALFRQQAEIYRTYHMQDPQAFYNKEDVWDVARGVQGEGAKPRSLEPVYVLTTLPGETQPEYVLLLPFTPRNKDNLIGVMMARCDGEHLGELRFLRLSKQALVFGPMQIEARINQDPEISKDLTLWSQKGSEVLRGQILTLPIENKIFYIEPIYIQASEARMPQLKKVVVATENELIYRNTYDEALAALAQSGGTAPTRAAADAVKSGTPAAEVASQSTADRRLGDIRQRLRRYRELWSQGKYGEAGKELEAVEDLASR
jgi:uncharacterized membrane protein (UPF0182 family)